ncbi:hypothetical protein V8F33_010131 [Rhypophila sp. PSN 637]
MEPDVRDVLASAACCTIVHGILCLCACAVVVGYPIPQYALPVQFEPTLPMLGEHTTDFELVCVVGETSRTIQGSQSPTEGILAMDFARQQATVGSLSRPEAREAHATGDLPEALRDATWGIATSSPLPAATSPVTMGFHPLTVYWSRLDATGLLTSRLHLVLVGFYILIGSPVYIILSTLILAQAGGLCGWRCYIPMASIIPLFIWCILLFSVFRRIRSGLRGDVQPGYEKWAMRYVFPVVAALQIILHVFFSSFVLDGKTIKRPADNPGFFFPWLILSLSVGCCFIYGVGVLRRVKP